MSIDETQAEPTPWWGSYTVDEENGGRWEVGPSTLWMYRNAHEWRLIHRASTDPATTDPMANRSEATVPVDNEELTAILEAEDGDLEVTRYSFGQTEARVDLEPALADRPVISRPEHPMHVPAGEIVTLYLSTPLWIRVVLPESDRLVRELPSHRMSDTWFGTSTTEGELCYATRTTGRLRLEKLPFRLHRALTPLRIQNSAEDALFLERVQLPVRHLSLYTTARDLLWTEAVRMTRTQGRQGADIQIRSGPPADVEGADLVQGPRDEGKKNLFTSTFGAFGALFGS